MDERMKELMEKMQDASKFRTNADMAMGYIKGLMYAGSVCVAKNQINIARLIFMEAEKTCEKLQNGVEDKIDELTGDKK